MISAKQEINQAPQRINDGVFSKTEKHAEIKRTAEGIRGRRWNGIGAIERLDDFLKHNRQAECHQNLVSMRALVEMFDQTAFHHIADDQHDGDRKQDRQRHVQFMIACPAASPNHIST